MANRPGSRRRPKCMAGPGSRSIASRIRKGVPVMQAELAPVRSASEPLFSRADFHLEPDVVHLCGAGETPFLRRHAAAFEAYAQDKSRGVVGREREYDKVTATREGVARFFGVPFDDIGFVASVAEG